MTGCSRSEPSTGNGGADGGLKAYGDGRGVTIAIRLEVDWLRSVTLFVFMYFQIRMFGFVFFGNTTALVLFAGGFSDRFGARFNTHVFNSFD